MILTAWQLGCISMRHVPDGTWWRSLGDARGCPSACCAALGVQATRQTHRAPPRRSFRVRDLCLVVGAPASRPTRCLKSCWTGKALRPLQTARTGRSAIHMERLAASSARSHKLRSWFSVAEWSDGLVGRHRALEARGSPTGAAFGGFDPSCRLPTRAVPGSHRAPSGGPRAPPHGLGRVDGRTGGAHRNPRAGKGDKSEAERQHIL